MTQYIALLRGINVGRAKRMAMAELRALINAMGGSHVSTLLNSGNVVFQFKTMSEAKLAKNIEARLLTHFGFTARTTVISASTLQTIVAENPLPEANLNPSKFLVAFVPETKSLQKMASLCQHTWIPDRIAIGTHAGYLACESGILQSQLLKAHSTLMGENTTTRNWATVLKLAAMVTDDTVKP